MKQFEYYTVHLRPEEDAVKVLDHYGKKGWEAFHIMPEGDRMVIYLKRKKP